MTHICSDTYINLAPDLVPDHNVGLMILLKGGFLKLMSFYCSKMDFLNSKTSSNHVNKLRITFQHDTIKTHYK